MPIKDPILRKEWHKKYWEKHKDYYSKLKKIWYTENKDEYKKKVRDYAIRKKDEIVEKKHQKYLERYSKESERLKEKSRLWLKNHKEYSNFKKKKRECIKKQAIPIWADMKKIRLYYEMAKLYDDVFEEKHHVDHIIPLNGKNVCGLHWEENLQILGAKENMKKGNKVVAPTAPASLRLVTP